MTSANIRQRVEAARTFLAANPEQARYTDKAATATLEEGLRCRTRGPDATLVTDMVSAIGGGGAGPSPGWVLRAALAVRTRVRIAADGAAPERLRELVEWAEAHSPVADALRRAVPMRTEIELA